MHSVEMHPVGEKIKWHEKKKELRVYGQVGEEFIGNLS